MNKQTTWTKPVGIIGIVLGVLGLLGSGQTVMLPTMLEMQQRMLTQMKQIDFAKVGDSTTQVEALPEEFFKMFEIFTDLPAWFTTFATAVGTAGFFIAGLYIFAFIRLLQRHPKGPILAYIALSAALVGSLAKIAGGVQLSSFWGVGFMTNGLFGIVVHTILIIVIVTADKSVLLTSQETVIQPPQVPKV